MKYILAEARHKHKEIDKLPAIFKDIQSNQIFDFDLHKEIANKTLKNDKGPITVYVTGLTPLLISVINYCTLFKKRLILYHYDSGTNHYVPQTVVSL